MNKLIVEQLINQLMDVAKNDYFVECNFYYMSRALKAQVIGTYMEEGLEAVLKEYRESRPIVRILIADVLLNKFYNPPQKEWNA
jgi:hypothetical protein